MEKASSKTGGLSATLWALFFAACLGLVVAHLVTVVQSQESSEGSAIESTFTRAPERR
jgi:hypothetical protein